MAKWRIKAYEFFNLPPGSYSYRSGKKELFADLAERSKDKSDCNLIALIAEYVLWANQQNDEGMQSCVDLAFFWPVLTNKHDYHELLSRLPQSLVDDKERILLSDV